MVKIIEYVQVSNFAPTQWMGITESDEGVYIRYRNNKLIIKIGENPVKGEIVYEQTHNLEGNHSGIMSTLELYQILSDDADIELKMENETRKTDLSPKLDEILSM